MGGPKGNQFWKIRTKHGRDKLFSTPEILWEAAIEYFEWCDNNPLIEIDFAGKDANRVEKPKMRPYTIKGLCIYLDCNEKYLSDLSNDFSEVVTRIKDVIYTQKFSGAAAGFLNPNIIARDLGLKDNQDHTTNGKTINTQSVIKVYTSGPPIP